MGPSGIVNGELLYLAAIYGHERARLRPISLALNCVFSPPPLAEARFALARTLRKGPSWPRSSRNAANVGSNLIGGAAGNFTISRGRPTRAAASLCVPE